MLYYSISDGIKSLSQTGEIDLVCQIHPLIFWIQKFSFWYLCEYVQGKTSYHHGIENP